MPVFSLGVDSTTTLFFRHKYWFITADELQEVEAPMLMFEEVRVAALPYAGHALQRLTPRAGLACLVDVLDGLPDERKAHARRL